MVVFAAGGREARVRFSAPRQDQKERDNMERKIRAILFDMNGIIIDDEHIHEMAFKESVKPYGIILTHEDYLECCAGKTDKAGYESISLKFSKTLPIDDLLHQKSMQYLSLFPANKKSYLGVIELIHFLSEHYILALTSSSSRQEVDLITSEFGIQRDFVTTISGNDVLKGKPNPEPYVLTAKKIGVQPNECVVIEDSKSGVISAKAAGCYCIGVTTTHTQEDLKQSDVVVADFASITLERIESLIK